MKPIENSTEGFTANYRNDQSFSELKSKPKWKPFRENVMISDGYFTAAINLPRRNPNGHIEVRTVQDLIKLCELISDDYYYTETIERKEGKFDPVSVVRNGAVCKVLERLESSLQLAEVDIHRKTSLLDISPYDRIVREWSATNPLKLNDNENDVISNYKDFALYDFSIDKKDGIVRLVVSDKPFKSVY
jgi:hypothetical protein